MPQHVRVGLEPEPGLTARTRHHAGEASGAEGRSPLRGEHEGRLGLLFALKAASAPVVRLRGSDGCLAPLRRARATAAEQGGRTPQ